MIQFYHLEAQQRMFKYVSVNINWSNELLEHAYLKNTFVCFSLLIMLDPTHMAWALKRQQGEYLKCHNSDEHQHSSLINKRFSFSHQQAHRAGFFYFRLFCTFSASSEGIPLFTTLGLYSVDKSANFMCVERKVSRCYLSVPTSVQKTIKQNRWKRYSIKI